jgi:hypothetical protein
MNVSSRLLLEGGGMNNLQIWLYWRWDELVKQVTESTEGFTLVLAGLKALLELNVRLNLVADRYPKGIEDYEQGESSA